MYTALFNFVSKEHGEVARGQQIKIDDEDYAKRLLKFGYVRKSKVFTQTGEGMKSLSQPVEKASPEKTAKKSKSGATKSQKKEKLL